MDESIEKTPFERIIELFTDWRVEFIVVGGQAETLHGSARVTFDIDVCYRRTRENLIRLAEALKRLHPRLRGAPPDLPFRLDAESLALGSNFTFVTDAGDLDMLGHLEPIGEYDDLVDHAEWFDIGGVRVLVISLDDLIRIKQHLQRPKDCDSLRHLLAIRKLKEEGKSRE